MLSCFWRSVLKRWFPVNCLVPNPQILWIKYYLNKKVLGQLWILSMLSIILEWRHSSISFSQKNGFCKFTWRTIALMRFHVLVFTLNHKSVFSRADDVTRPHSLLRDITRLSILNENVVLVVPQEKPSFAIVSITLLWAQGKKTVFWSSDNVIMMSQTPGPKLRLDAGSFLLSDT